MGDTLFGLTAVRVGDPLLLFFSAGTYTLGTDNPGSAFDDSIGNATFSGDYEGQGLYSTTSAVVYSNTWYLHPTTGVDRMKEENRLGSFDVAWYSTPTDNPYITSTPVLAASPGDAKVALNWSQPTLVGSDSRAQLVYLIKRGTSSPPGSTIASGLTARSYLDTGRTNGTKYFYRVTADIALVPGTTGIGVGSLSNIANATPFVAKEFWGTISA